jgi:putative transposase
VGVTAACRAVGRPRATYYDQHRQSPRPVRPSRPRRPPPSTLSPAERQAVLDVLHSERFCDQSPYEVYATLLDEGVYLASIRTFYRILQQEGEVHERRAQATHPARVKPELMADAPRQVWSWDITKLKGPTKGIYYYLYVLIDVYSRYVVGWLLAPQESAELAKQLIADSVERESVEPGNLTVHADNGSSMASKPVALLLEDLGVAKSHSRPHTSNDNPYSESQFKTLKYRPNFPERFDSIEQARAFCREFFPWYNDEHRHSGIGLLTPAMVHHGTAPEVTERRAAVLADAYARHPERFPNGHPHPQAIAENVWINRPDDTP